MEHVRKTHWTNQEQEKKSFFHTTEIPHHLFESTLQEPDFIMPHPLKDNRTWLFKKFFRTVGQHGFNHYPCHWVALCVADGQEMVTMYPVPHPKACGFVRKYLAQQQQQQRHS